MNTPEEVTSKIIRISTSKDSPLEKWIDELENENLAELYINHFAYAWLYIQDNNLLEMNDENVKHYFVRAYQEVHKLAPNIEVDSFYEIYTDRFQNLKKELSMVRKEQFSGLGYFPSYFYGRLLNYPLKSNPINSIEFKYDGHWNDTDLAGMFTHHINHLQDNLNETFK